MTKQKREKRAYILGVSGLALLQFLANAEDDIDLKAPVLITGGSIQNEEEKSTYHPYAITYVNLTDSPHFPVRAPSSPRRARRSLRKRV